MTASRGRGEGLGGARPETLRGGELTGAVLGAAIQVHRVLGPGLLESAYQRCLEIELRARRISYERQREVVIEYAGQQIGAAYRLDFLVGGQLVVEVKSVEALHDVHRSQLLTYMRLGGFPVGLVLNFNEPILKNGIMRMVL